MDDMDDSFAPTGNHVIHVIHVIHGSQVSHDGWRGLVRAAAGRIARHCAPLGATGCHLPLVGAQWRAMARNGGQRRGVAAAGAAPVPACPILGNVL